MNHHRKQVLFKEVTVVPEMDKPPTYKEKEDVLENEEEQIATRRKEKGRIN